MPNVPGRQPRWTQELKGEFYSWFTNPGFRFLNIDIVSLQVSCLRATFHGAISNSQ